MKTFQNFYPNFISLTRIFLLNQPASSVDGIAICSRKNSEVSEKKRKKNNHRSFKSLHEFLMF